VFLKSYLFSSNLRITCKVADKIDIIYTIAGAKYPCLDSLCKFKDIVVPEGCEPLRGNNRVFCKFCSTTSTSSKNRRRYVQSRRKCAYTICSYVYCSEFIFLDGYMPEYGTMSMLLTVYWVNSPKGLQWGNINPSLAQAVRYHLPAHYPSDSFSIVDCGDYVIVTNSRKVKVTCKKEQQVLFRKHSTMGLSGSLLLDFDFYVVSVKLGRSAIPI
jgi:hypothetical protein